MTGQNPVIGRNKNEIQPCSSGTQECDTLELPLKEGSTDLEKGSHSDHKTNEHGVSMVCGHEVKCCNFQWLRAKFQKMFLPL